MEWKIWAHGGEDDELPHSKLLAHFTGEHVEPPRARITYCLGRVGRCFASRVAAEERVWSTPVEILTARRVSMDDDLVVDAP